MNRLVLRWRESAAGRMQSRGVEPVDPFECRELDVCERLPRSFAVDLLGLVEADRGLGKRVVVGVADGSDRRVDAGVDQPLRERETRILSSSWLPASV